MLKSQTRTRLLCQYLEILKDGLLYHVFLLQREIWSYTLLLLAKKKLLEFIIIEENEHVYAKYLWFEEKKRASGMQISHIENCSIKN